jgi:hypothetical protein
MPDLSWRQAEPRNVGVYASPRRAVGQRMLRRLVRLSPLGRASRGYLPAQGSRAHVRAAGAQDDNCAKGLKTSAMKT